METTADARSLFPPQANLVEFSQSIVPGVEMKRCRRSPYDYKAHVHRELMLAYILEGSTDLTLPDGTLHFSAGDGAVIPPFFSHRCTPNDIDHWVYVVLFIDPKYYGESVRFTCVGRLEGSQAQKLGDVIGQLCAERDPDALANALIDLLAGLADEDTQAAPAAMEKIHGYLQKNIYAPVSLDQLEEKFGINKYSLIKGFRKAYATTPAAFHLQCRVSEAKALIGRGRDIFEICDALHFYDQAHLIREFRKMYGITPAAYAEQRKR